MSRPGIVLTHELDALLKPLVPRKIRAGFSQLLQSNKS